MLGYAAQERLQSMYGKEKSLGGQLDGIKVFSILLLLLVSLWKLPSLLHIMLPDCTTLTIEIPM